MQTFTCRGGFSPKNTPFPVPLSAKESKGHVFYILFYNSVRDILVQGTFTFTSN